MISCAHCPKTACHESSTRPATAAGFRIRNIMIAVPSFIIASPSTIAVMRLSTPKSLSKATTATGSVAERIEPKRPAAKTPQLG